MTTITEISNNLLYFYTTQDQSLAMGIVGGGLVSNGIELVRSAYKESLRYDDPSRLSRTARMLADRQFWAGLGIAVVGAGVGACGVTQLYGKIASYFTGAPPPLLDLCATSDKVDYTQENGRLFGPAFLQFDPSDSRKKLLILGPRSDHNSALHPNLTKPLFKSLNRKFDVRYASVGSMFDICREVDQYGSQLSGLMIDSHARANGIRIGPHCFEINQYGTWKIFDPFSPPDCFAKLAPEAVIGLTGCLLGSDDASPNFAQWISMLSQREVIASAETVDSRLTFFDGMPDRFSLRFEHRVGDRIVNSTRRFDPSLSRQTISSTIIPKMPAADQVISIFCFSAALGACLHATQFAGRQISDLGAKRIHSENSWVRWGAKAISVIGDGIESASQSALGGLSHITDRANSAFLFRALCGTGLELFYSNPLAKSIFGTLSDAAPALLVPHGLELAGKGLSALGNLAEESGIAHLNAAGRELSRVGSVVERVGKDGIETIEQVFTLPGRLIDGAVGKAASIYSRCKSYFWK